MNTSSYFRASTRAFSSNLKGAALSSVAAAAFALAPSAMAQDQDDGTSIFAEEILVTARKRVESAQTVPIAISAFTGDSLEARGITQTDDIANFTPNLTFQNSPGFGGGTNIAAIYIRGIGQFDFLGSIEPGVGLYIDGVYIARSVGAIMDLVEIERLEVLRGPQGTLFGRNTIGGAINITTKKPNEEFGGNVSAAYGDDNRVELRASVNVPATDELFFKVSGALTNRDGYVTRINGNPHPDFGDDLGNQDTVVGRFQARWEPSEDFTADLSFDYSNDKSNGAPFVTRGARFGSQFFNPQGLPLAPPPLPGPEGGAPFPDFSQIGGTPSGNGFVRNLVGIVPGADPNALFYQLNVREQALLNGAPATFVAPIDGAVDNFILLNNFLASYGPGGVPGTCVSAPFEPYAAFTNNPACYGPQYFEQNIGAFNNAGTDRSGSETTVWGGSLELNYQWDNVQLRSITAYRSLESLFEGDLDGTPTNVQYLIDEIDQSQFSQEFQVLGTSFDDKLNWIVGLYYFSEDVDNRNDVFFTPVSVRSGGLIENKSFAAFAQGTYDITEQLSLTVGVRYTKDDKTFDSGPYQYILSSNVGPDFVGGFAACPDALGDDDGADACPAPIQLFAPAYNPNDPSTTLQPVQLATDSDGELIPLPLGLAGPLTVYETRVTEQDASEVNPYVNLSYQWTEEIMTYASFSQGFKSGGFTQRVFPPLAAVPSVGPEKVDVYELGMKSTLFDNLMRLNVSLFRTDYDDLQVQGFTLETGVAPVYTNAASARIQGFEVEYAFFLPEGLYIEGGVGYTDAKYREVAPTLLGVTADNALAFVPEWTATAAVQKQFALGNLGSLTPRVDWSYRSKVFNEASNVEEIAQPGYSVFNATLMWKDESERYSIQAAVINLAGKDYIHSASFNANAPGFNVLPNRGREWYIRAGYNF